MEELLFQDLKNWLYEDKRNSEWTTIYQDVAKTTPRRIVYAIMLPENLTEKFLAHHSWSLNSTLGRHANIL